MRLKIGHKFSISRALPASTAPTTSVASPSKLDVEPRIQFVDPASDPLKLEVNVPAYSLSTYNSLQSITAIAIPAADPEPTTAELWMASSYPKLTLSLAPSAPASTPAATPASTVISGTPAPAPAAVPVAVPAAAPVVAATMAPATPAVAIATPASQAAIAVAAPAAAPSVAVAPIAPAVAATPAPASTTPSYLPGPAGGVATFLIPGVPAGAMKIQLIEQFDA